MRKTKNSKSLLERLVDDDGIKTEVTITLTSQTLIKIVAALLVSGATIALITHTVRNRMPNRQLSNLEKDIASIQSHLKQHLK
jgi:ribosomal protein S15P/S13E